MTGERVKKKWMEEKREGGEVHRLVQGFQQTMITIFILTSGNLDETF